MLARHDGAHLRRLALAQTEQDGPDTGLRAKLRWRGQVAKRPRRTSKLVETPDLADWLKVPSDVIASLGDPAVQTPADVMRYLEEQGLADTPLYRRLQADPDFETKIRQQKEERHD